MTQLVLKAGKQRAGSKSSNMSFCLPVYITWWCDLNCTHKTTFKWPTRPTPHNASFYS